MTSLNGEILSGISLALMAILFIIASFFNAAWSLILPVDYLILAIGAALIILGVVTLKRSNKSGQIHEHSH